MILQRNLVVAWGDFFPYVPVGSYGPMAAYGGVNPFSGNYEGRCFADSRFLKQISWRIRVERPREAGEAKVQTQNNPRLSMHKIVT